MRLVLLILCLVLLQIDCQSEEDEEIHFPDPSKIWGRFMEKCRQCDSKNRSECTIYTKYKDECAAIVDYCNRMMHRGSIECMRIRLLDKRAISLCMTGEKCSLTLQDGCTGLNSVRDWPCKEMIAFTIAKDFEDDMLYDTVRHLCRFAKTKGLCEEFIYQLREQGTKRLTLLHGVFVNLTIVEVTGINIDQAWEDDPDRPRMLACNGGFCDPTLWQMTKDYLKKAQAKPKDWITEFLKEYDACNKDVDCKKNWIQIFVNLPREHLTLNIMQQFYEKLEKETEAKDFFGDSMKYVSQFFGIKFADCPQDELLFCRFLIGRMGKRLGDGNKAEHRVMDVIARNVVPAYKKLCLINRNESGYLECLQAVWSICETNITKPLCEHLIKMTFRSDIRTAAEWEPYLSSPTVNLELGRVMLAWPYFFEDKFYKMSADLCNIVRKRMEQEKDDTVFPPFPLMDFCEAIYTAYERGNGNAKFDYPEKACLLGPRSECRQLKNDCLKSKKMLSCNYIGWFENKLEKELYNQMISCENSSSPVCPNAEKQVFTHKLKYSADKSQILEIYSTGGTYKEWFEQTLDPKKPFVIHTHLGKFCKKVVHDSAYSTADATCAILARTLINPAKMSYTTKIYDQLCNYDLDNQGLYCSWILSAFWEVCRFDSPGCYRGRKYFCKAQQKLSVGRWQPPWLHRLNKNCWALFDWYCVQKDKSKCDELIKGLPKQMLGRYIYARCSEMDRPQVGCRPVITDQLLANVMPSNKYDLIEWICSENLWNKPTCQWSLNFCATDAGKTLITCSLLKIRNCKLNLDDHCFQQNDWCTELTLGKELCERLENLWNSQQGIQYKRLDYTLRALDSDHSVSQEMQSKFQEMADRNQLAQFYISYSLYHEFESEKILAFCRTSDHDQCQLVEAAATRKIESFCWDGFTNECREKLESLCYGEKMRKNCFSVITRLSEAVNVHLIWYCTTVDTMLCEFAKDYLPLSNISLIIHKERCHNEVDLEMNVEGCEWVEAVCHARPFGGCKLLLEHDAFELKFGYDLLAVTCQYPIPLLFLLGLYLLCIRYSRAIAHFRREVAKKWTDYSNVLSIHLLKWKEMFIAFCDKVKEYMMKAKRKIE